MYKIIYLRFYQVIATKYINYYVAINNVAT